MMETSRKYLILKERIGNWGDDIKMDLREICYQDF
jgi:hypothetical protein